MLIYKILRMPEWHHLQASGQSGGAPVDLADGYIHFSTADTVQATLDKHFAGEADLWLVVCETGPMGDVLRWETSRGGQLFPHLYRELRLSDVTTAAPLIRRSDGTIAALEN